MRAKALLAEFTGTFLLMASLLGAALYSFAAAKGAAGILGVSLSIGLTVAATALAIGHASGGHYNPAVTVGLVVARRFSVRDALPYIIAQCLGTIAACALFAAIGPGGSFAANGYGALSLTKAPMLSVMAIEAVMTAFLVMVVLGVTRPSADPGQAPFAIGATLIAIHLMTIPISNTSVNPARSLGPALFAGGEALSQVWVFWVAPLAGALIGALLYTLMADEDG